MNRVYLIVGIFLFVISCHKDDSDPVPAIKDPTEAMLIFPFKNSECNEGTEITTTTSKVLFEWRQAENTDKYELVLINLSTADQSSHMTSEHKIPIVLLRATPYAWYVISKSNETDSTVQSETWRFFNAGEGIESYTPFPAEIISPLMAESITAPGGTITLDWDGSDVDDDIVGYDVYFDTTNPPDLFESNLQESVLADIQVESESIYYWSVTTKDAHGNSSESGIYQFRVL